MCADYMNSVWPRIEPDIVWCQYVRILMMGPDLIIEPCAQTRPGYQRFGREDQYSDKVRLKVRRGQHHNNTTSQQHNNTTTQHHQMLIVRLTRPV